MSKYLKSSLIVISALLLILGSFVVVSAEMGLAVARNSEQYVTDPDTGEYETDETTGEYIKEFVSGAVVEQSSASIVRNVLTQLGILTFCVFSFFAGLMIPFKKIPFIWYLIGGVVMLILLLIPLFFAEVNDAKAWITIGSFSLQPSEIAKGYMIVMGALCARYAYKLKNRNFLWIYIVIGLVYFLIIMFLQKDTGSAMIMFVISFCIVYISTSKESQSGNMHDLLTKLLLIAVLLIVLSMTDFFNEFLYELYSSEKLNKLQYMVGRFLAAWNPFKGQYSYGQQIIRSIASIAENLFNFSEAPWATSIIKYQISSAESDMILSVLIDETGIYGFSVFLILYCSLFFVLAKGAYSCEKIENRVILFGLFCYFFLHFILNIGGGTAFLPLTGVPLIFISSGGTVSVVTSALIGLAVQVMSEEIQCE